MFYIKRLLFSVCFLTIIECAEFNVTLHFVVQGFIILTKDPFIIYDRDIVYAYSSVFIIYLIYVQYCNYS